MKLRYSIMFFLFGFAGVCAIFGGNEFVVSQQSSKEPEEIPLVYLIARGRTGNPNVIVTDFEIVPEFAVESKYGQWRKVWVPIVPKGTNVDKKTQISAVIFSDRAKNTEQLYELIDRAKLQGLIDQESAKLGLVATLRWKSKFPNMDLKNCTIIVEGKQPAGFIKLGLYAFGFVFFSASFFGVWFLARKLDQTDDGTKSVVDASLGTGPIAAELVDDSPGAGPITAELVE